MKRDEYIKVPVPIIVSLLVAAEHRFTKYCHGFKYTILRFVEKCGSYIKTLENVTENCS